MINPVLAQTAAEAASPAEFWVFLLVGAVSLGSALAMIMVRNAVHAALLLVVNFFTIAIFYAVLEAQFLAAVQIIVYAGAIMVLFLFVIMLLGVGADREAIPRPAHRQVGTALQRLGTGPRMQGPMAAVFGVVLFAGLLTTVAAPYIGPNSVCPDGDAVVAEQEGEGLPCEGLAALNAEGNTEAVGLRLFTDYVWPFEVTSALLVIAAIGSIVIGKREGLPEDATDTGPQEPDTPDDESATTPAAELSSEEETP